ncbi:MAG: hypothetical protein LBQ54_14465 [Planctomycetaceae bacterium]|nr:hypothetical protein [Planctomycetaceae bacterium]
MPFAPPAACGRCIPEGTTVPGAMNPLPLVAGKRAASPHIASGWKDDPSETDRLEEIGRRRMSLLESPLSKRNRTKGFFYTIIGSLC